MAPILRDAGLANNARPVDATFHGSKRKRAALRTPCNGPDFLPLGSAGCFRDELISCHETLRASPADC
jgi:hypothetical protein